MGWSEAMAFRDCPWCGLRDAQMRLLGSNGAANTARGPRYWSFVSCPRCGGAVALEHGPPNHNETDARLSVPADERSSDVAHLPPDVEDFYEGAIRALDAGLPDAAAVQLRRTLEAAAAKHEHDERVLVERVEGLIEDGLVTKQFGDVLHHVRKVGNVGAHASDERVSEEEARRVLRFTTQVLRNLFEVPAELEALGQEDDDQ